MFLEKNKTNPCAATAPGQKLSDGREGTNEALSMSSTANSLLELRLYAIRRGHNYLSRIIEPVVKETLEIAHNLEHRYEKYELVEEYKLKQAKHGKQVDLSLQQVECLKWCSIGKTDREIAQELGIQESTVLREMNVIREKLDTTTDAHSVARAIREKLI